MKTWFLWFAGSLSVSVALVLLVEGLFGDTPANYLAIPGGILPILIANRMEKHADR